MSNDSRTIRVQQSGTTISLFVSFIVLLLAMAAGLARLGFSNHHVAPLLKAVGVGWLLIHFPFAVRPLLVAAGSMIFRRSHFKTRLWAKSILKNKLFSEPTEGFEATSRNEGRSTDVESASPLASTPEIWRSHCSQRDSWLTSDPSLLLAGVAIVTLIGQFTPDGSPILGAGLAIVGAAAFVVRLFRSTASAGFLSVLAALALAMFVSTFIAGASWGSGYHNPLFVEALGFGESNIDTLYHTSVCQMIRTHNVASTGVDGIPWLHYHFGSHWIFAALSRLLGMSAVDFFNVGYQIVIIPFCLLSLLTFADTLSGTGVVVDAKRNDGRPSSQQHVQRGWLFWFVVCAGYAGVLPLSALVQSPISRHSLIISESYALAIAVALLTTASLVRFQNNIDSCGSRSSRFEFAAGLLVFPVLVGAIGLIKLSVMIVAVTGLLYIFIRTGLFRNWQWILTAAATLVCVAMAWQTASSPRFFAETGWVPFGFLRLNVAFQWWPYFWLIYYLWVWVYVVSRLYEGGVTTVSGLVDLFRSREAVDLEVLIVAALVGAVPGVLLTGYSGAHYFSDCQRWLAIGLLLGMIQTRSAHSQPAADDDAAHKLGKPGTLSLLKVAGIVVAVSVVLTMTANTLTLLRDAVAVNLASRGVPGGGTGLGRCLMRGELSAARRILEQQAADVEARLERESPILGRLQELDRTPRTEKRKTLLYIPKSNRQYWEFLHGRYWPRDVPFVAPALSGMAMIDGLFETAESGNLYGYGYDRYERPAHGPSGQPPPHEYKPELCRRAATMGFERIIVLTADEDSKVHSETWTCATATSDQPTAASRNDSPTAD